MENRKNFGKILSGSEAFLYTLKAGNIQLDVTDFGASWVNLCFKGTDILLGYDSVGQYESSKNYFGAVVGRVGNRIGNSSFSLNGKTYNLESNEGTNSLHGGIHGYDKRIWKTNGVSDDGRKITFSLNSPSGDQGYPGNLDLSVTYEVTENNEILTTYKAKSDEDTLCNPTNHSYFNLNGSNGANIENHILKIDADKYLEVDEKLLPIGTPSNVEGTPFDFRAGKEIGKDIRADNKQIKLGGGYDHNYVLNGNGDINFDIVEVVSPVTGICMKMSTTMPGIQFYAGNMLDDQTGKNGEIYTKRSGLALETQFFPDSIHHSEYPSAVLRQGEEKKYLTRYTFK